MFKYDQLRSVHIEITSRCQAACPMCARNVHSGLENPSLVLADWSLDDFKKIFPVELIQQLDHILFCGNLGDPMINDDLIDMCRYSRDANPNVSIHIHTNGGARKTSWWVELAESLPKIHNVFFAIDGLEDTHSLYRVNTDYNTVVRNAKSFIEAGGNATWVFLKFAHNEHQVEEAQSRAKEFGFSKFSMKSTVRFVGEPRFAVYDKDGNTKYYLEPPSDSKMNYTSNEVVLNFKNIVAQSTISCYAQHSKEVYIDAYKRVGPCCYMGAIPTIQYRTDDITSSVRTEMRQQHHSLFSSLGNTNALEKSIKEIVESDAYQTVWNDLWDGPNKLIICARTCGKIEKNQIAQPKDQFIKITQLDK